jgi:hypothetical protein
VAFGRLDLRGGALGRDVTEELQGIRLIALTLLGSGDLEGLLAELHRLIYVASHHIALSQPDGEERSQVAYARELRLL